MKDQQSPSQTPLHSAPKQPAQEMELRAQPKASMRLNPRVLAVLVGGLSSAMLGALFWSFQPRQRPTTEAQELYNVDQVQRSEALQSLPRDYSQLPRAKPEVPKLGPPLPGDLGGPIAQVGVQGAGMTPQIKEEEQAARSEVFFRLKAGSSSSAERAPSQGTALSPAIPSPTLSVSPANDPNQQTQKEAFSRDPGSTQTRNSGTLQEPESPYQLMAGTVIAAALVTGIQSDLPGDVIATVTEPVYDSASGRYMLIPQGSRLMGRYNSQLSFGQSRVQVAWQRLILPDTSSIELDNLVGSDPAGNAGLSDGVNQHWDRMIAGAAMTTLLGVAAELAAPQDSNDGDRVIIAGRDSLQDSVNQVGQELTRRNLDIQPTLTERPGLPLRVIVNRDLVLRPYPLPPTAKERAR